MLDYVLISTSPRIRSESLYRCNRCGQSSLTGSDGFLMSRCMSCGSWQPAHESADAEFIKHKEKFIAWFRKVKDLLVQAECRRGGQI